MTGAELRTLATTPRSNLGEAMEAAPFGSAHHFAADDSRPNLDGGVKVVGQLPWSPGTPRANVG
jgi:hypothetical protein